MRTGVVMPRGHGTARLRVIQVGHLDRCSRTGKGEGSTFVASAMGQEDREREQTPGVAVLRVRHATAGSICVKLSRPDADGAANEQPPSLCICCADGCKNTLEGMRELLL